jgi:hypothetical protein
MIKHARTAIIAILIASSFLAGGAWAAAGEKLPDPATAGFAERLYRVDCGHSLANDESVWTPRRKRWEEHRVLVDLLADQAGKRMGALGYGCSPICLERPQRLVNAPQVDRLPSG